jgi:hypothetical protein
MGSPLFDCLNAINLKNKSYQYNKKDVSAYMLLLWFSHDPDCIDIVDKINERLFDIPDEMVYHYLYEAVPQKRRFIKWDKGTKNKDLLKKERKIIDGLKEQYGFSEYEAKKLYVLYMKR